VDFPAHFGVQMPVKLLWVRIGPAPYGLGVFACRRFRRNEKIGRVYGEVVHDYRNGSEYAVDLGNNRLLEPDEPFRYLNHSCQPNCELLNYTPDNARHDAHEVYLKALRPIAAGEELTIDYAWSAEVAIPCGCRAERCRGWIVSVEQLPRMATAGDKSPQPIP
jgi:hypothetical protein